jgi:cyclic pyranopterin phosphate synthase
MRKLRISLTDACNYRCFYCMPSKPEFTPRGELLSPAEYRRLGGALVEAGIEEFRVTGGEPTVRPEFEAILDALGSLPVRRKGVTSNGHLLGRHLRFLKATGWTHVNISLDSLDAGRFSAITGGGDFRTVMACIEKAAAIGLQVKLNSVVMRGVNDDELGDFVAWSSMSGIEVRFLEYMRIGPDLRDHARRFMDAGEMLARLGMTYGLRRLPAAADSTSIRFVTEHGARLGLIASESKPFCGQCSRLRLSATGVLRPCVMSPQGVSIRHADPEDLPDLFDRVVAMKPMAHAESNAQPMHALGG